MYNIKKEIGSVFKNSSIGDFGNLGLFIHFEFMCGNGDDYVKVLFTPNCCLLEYDYNLEESIELKIHSLYELYKENLHELYKENLLDLIL